MADKQADAVAGRQDAGRQDVSQRQDAQKQTKESNVREHLANPADKDLHPDGMPEMSADQSSYPGGEATIDDPPVRVPRAGDEVLGSLATGAGQHVPPDPEQYDEQGRPRDVE